jgi:phosphatidylglycerophosphate synthase
MAVSLGLQQLLVGLAVWRANRAGPGARGLDWVDALTLSRGATAAWLAGLLVAGVRDRTGSAGWVSWLTLLPSVTLTDWIDGPLARRRGSSVWGEALDIELDSWLSTTASLSSVAWGGLPRFSVVPTLARYLLPLVGARQGRYGEAVDLGKSWWARGTGIAYAMGVLVALAPFRGAASGRVARQAMYLIVPLQAACLVRVLAHLYRRSESPERTSQP